MKQLSVWIATLFLAIVAHAAPISAVLTFESAVLTADGVKKQTYFQERLVRDQNVIWTERIVPKTAPKHNHEADDHGDEHNMNFALAGKWLVQDGKGQVKYRVVRAEDKKIIEPRTTEYATLGFDGDWDAAYYLVNRAALKKMTLLKIAAPAGAQWYEKRDAKHFTRVLWDAQKELPLSIESGKIDGSANNKITLEIVPVPAKLPWSTLAGYKTMAYEDLLD